MDTNMSQALKLAGGILIALVLITGLTMMFSRLSPSQNTLEDIKAFEQTQEFNKEFEVYNKDIMYGLDVISAINKAASYNRTYIDEYDWSDDLKNNYLIDIEINSDICLKQNIYLYKINENAKEVQINCENIVETEDKNAICDGLGIELSNFDNENEKNLSSCSLIDKTRSDKNLGSGKYIKKEIYESIIEPSSKQLKKTIINTKNPNVWSKAVLETYVYNFKSKKFRCTGVEYSDITQRITKLVFQEI